MNSWRRSDREGSRHLDAILAISNRPDGRSYVKPRTVGTCCVLLMKLLCHEPIDCTNRWLIDRRLFSRAPEHTFSPLCRGIDRQAFPYYLCESPVRALSFETNRQPFLFKFRRRTIRPSVVLVAVPLAFVRRRLFVLEKSILRPGRCPSAPDETILATRNSLVTFPFPRRASTIFQPRPLNRPAANEPRRCCSRVFGFDLAPLGIPAAKLRVRTTRGNSRSAR